MTNPLLRARGLRKSYPTARGPLDVLAGLDVDTIRALEDALLDFSGCVLVISHDRFFLDRVCTHLLVFEGDGKLRWFDGNFEEYHAKRMEETGGQELNRRSKYKKLTLR